jgi:glycosyltransferase involved in cell wall biosynthesis
MDDIGVIIVNDGSDVHLSEDFFERYSYDIEYYLNEHKGVSATRNACLDKATADYVMFCDADDMFYNACGLYIIFKEIENNGFDSLSSTFIEESREPDTKDPIYINHVMDSTFVHGKVHNRKFLLKNKIRWNDNLTVHEDSYFNCLCQRLAKELKYSSSSFYLWKWRDDSVCRHDPKYILKTYNKMLDSNDALVD